jgi:MoaA/NifB/PqqE/SkfB family radical SAM enzyme
MERLGNKIGIFFPYGPGGETQHFDLMLSAEEKRKCFETLEGIEQKYSMVFKAEGYISAKKPANYFLNQGCRAGINIHITPEGFVEPCNGIQFHTGNIFETTLEEIVRSPFYRDIYSCALKNDKRCIIIHEARQVYDILQKHNAAECHTKAYDNLRRQMEFIPCKQPLKTGHANPLEGVN